MPNNDPLELDLRPLADQLRPETVRDVVGQDHLLAQGKPLRRAVEDGVLHSMVLWGPPGTGKTTIARLLSHHADAEFLQLPAVLSGVKDIRAAVERAQTVKQIRAVPTVVFVDEVHRFNKAQQDAFLPHIEDGTITFVGATTENPAFQLNNALLSRLRVYVLRSLEPVSIRVVVDRALDRLDGVTMDDALRDELAASVDGDARRALNLIELAANLSQDGAIDAGTLEAAIGGGQVRRFDNKGDDFYDQISALHKSVRGSDPDAALYWFARMVDGGGDPLYIARRVVRIASEDIGNADPRALRITLDAWEAQERLGSPEGELAIAQAIVYCACAPKSNAVYRALSAASGDIERYGSAPVPAHLRNAPTRLARSLGHSEGYRYDHDEPGGFAAGQRYFPDKMADRRYYEPVDRGLEIKIAEKLERLRRLTSKATDDQARTKSKNK